MKRTSPKAGKEFNFYIYFLLLCFSLNCVFFSGFLLVRMMKSSYIRKALLVGCLIQLFQQAAGINTGCKAVSAGSWHQHRLLSCFNRQLASTQVAKHFQQAAGINTGY
jgi:hypothetical protein